jgi:KH domain
LLLARSQLIDCLSLRLYHIILFNLRLLCDLNLRHIPFLKSLDKKAQIDGTGTKEQLDLRCLIPTAASGSIIGRGGSVIKEIGEKTNCHLNLERDNGPGGQDVYNTKERALTIKSTLVANISNVRVILRNNDITYDIWYVFINIGIVSRLW